MASVGQMTAKAIIDTKEGEESLNRLDMSAAKFSKRLESIGEKPLSVLQKLKGDLTDIRFAMDQATDPATLKRLSAEYEATERKIADATGKSFSYRRQQMREEQMYTMRSVALLMSLSTIYNMLSGSEDDQAGKQKEVNKALREGVEVTTGASFALMMMGGEVAKLALPIGATLGVLFTLWKLLQNVDEAAEAASKQGLKDFMDQFAKLTPEGQQFTAGQVAGALGAAKRERDQAEKEYYAKNPAATSSGAYSGAVFDSTTYDKTIKFLQDRYDKIMESAHAEYLLKQETAENSKLIERNMNLYQRLAKKLEPLQVKASKGIATQAEIDRIEQLNAWLNELRKSSNQLAADRQTDHDKMEQEIDKLISQSDKDIRSSIQNEKTLVEIKKQSYDDAVASLELLKFEALSEDQILEIDKAIFELRKKEADEAKKAAQERYKDLEDTLSQAQRTATLLSRAFNKSGDDFLSKLATALQLVAQIAKIMNSANKPGSSGLGVLDFAEIAGNLLGIGMLFDEGGWTGPGQRSKVAGLVHADEIVFEKPIVERYRPQLMGLRAAMGGGRGNYRDYAGYAGGGFTGSSSGSSMMIGDLSPVLRELKGLRDDLAKGGGMGMSGLPPLVTLEKALISAYPAYKKKDNDKHIFPAAK